MFFGSMEKVYSQMAQNVELRRKLAREVGLGFSLTESVGAKAETSTVDCDVISAITNLGFKVKNVMAAYSRAEA
jgi:hypothetical protein